jgi:predicted dehydrogenase
MRFGIIGEGDDVLRAYQDLGAAQGAQVTAVMAASAAVRRELGALLSTGIVETVEEVCADPQVQAVYIALSGGTREEAIRQSLAAGKHVLVAGPWDAPLAEGRELCALAKEKGLAFGLSAPWAVSGAHLAVRTLTRAGLLGEILSWRDDLLRPQPMADALRQALRPLDLFAWLTNLEPQEVYAQQAPSAEGIELYAVMVRYANGCIGGLQVGRGVPGGPGMHPQGMRIIGALGQFDMTDEPMVYRTRSSEDAPAHTWQRVRHTGLRGSRSEAMSQFAASVARGQEPALPAKVILGPLAILEAVQRSLAEGTPVPVTL